jgi:two-component system, NarL family, nitrate/nitrite response regulator NarL
MPEMIPVTKLPNDRGAVRIAVADGQAMFRAALRRLLEAQPEFHVIAEASDGVEAAAIVRKARPDVLLLELDLRRSSGLEVLREIDTSPPMTIPLLLVAAIEEEQLVEALCLGAHGMVVKTATVSLLVKSIRAVMAGEYWLQRDRVSLLVRALCQRGGGNGHGLPQSVFGLNPRELEVVAAIADGSTVREMAQTLSRSEITMRHQLTNIFRKLGVRNRTELAAFALKHKLGGNGSPASTLSPQNWPRNTGLPGFDTMQSFGRAHPSGLGTVESRTKTGFRIKEGGGEL